MNIPIVRMMKDPVTSCFGNVSSLSMNRSASRSEFTRTRHGCTLCGDGAWMAVSRSVVQISALFAPVLLVMSPLEQQAADASACGVAVLHAGHQEASGLPRGAPDRRLRDRPFGRTSIARRPLSWPRLPGCHPGGTGDGRDRGD